MVGRLLTLLTALLVQVQVQVQAVTVVVGDDPKQGLNIGWMDGACYLSRIKFGLHPCEMIYVHAVN